MRIQFFTNTPAHVHLYKHVVQKLNQRGHDARILARDYGCTVDLLEWFDLPYTIYGKCGTDIWSLLAHLPGQYARLLRATRTFDPDLIFGMGSYAAHAGGIFRTPTILVLDSEPTSVDIALSKPFASAILTPDAFRKDLGSNHYTFSGFKESAYLHPEVYEPNPGVRDRLGVGIDEQFVIVRLNAFGSHHDLGKGGFTPGRRRKLIEQLSTHATVFVSDEGDSLDLSSLPARSFDLHPALLHDALAEAQLLVTDTQTMATEAALLGTPTIRSNSFVGDDDMGNFIELESAGLIENVADFDSVLELAETMLTNPDIKQVWHRRRDEYLRSVLNVTDLLVAVAESHTDIESVDALRPAGEPAVRQSQDNVADATNRMRRRQF